MKPQNRSSPVAYTAKGVNMSDKIMLRDLHTNFPERLDLTKAVSFENRQEAQGYNFALDDCDVPADLSKLKLDEEKLIYLIMHNIPCGCEKDSNGEREVCEYCMMFGFAESSHIAKAISNNLSELLVKKGE